MSGQLPKSGREIVVLEVQSGEVMSQVAGVVHSLLNQVVDFAGVRRFGGVLFGEFKLEPLGHEGDAGKFLAEVIVQIQPDAAALLFGDLEQFMFEAFAFRDSGTKFGVGGVQFSGPLLNTEFEFVMSFAEGFLGSTTLLFRVPSLPPN